MGRSGISQKAAERVYGVKSVENDLNVRILTEHARDDADIRGSVLQALMLDSLVPSTIDARVDDGWVTPTGTAAWQYRRDEAEFIAGNVLGVLGVDDQIELESPEPSAGDIKESIKKALRRNGVGGARRLEGRRPHRRRLLSRPIGRERGTR